MDESELLDRIEERLRIYRDMLWDQSEGSEVFAYHATGVQAAMRIVREFRAGNFDY